MVGAGYFGAHVTKMLSAAGFRDPAAESSRASDLMSQQFGQGDLGIVFAIRGGGGVADPQVRAVAQDVAGQLAASPDVDGVVSAWSAPPAAARELTSSDGRTGLVAAGITGGGSDAQRHAKELADRIAGPRGDVEVVAGGPAMAYVQINSQSERDLIVMEAVAFPLSFAVLVWVFGGLLAAAIPLAVGIWSVVGTMALLRLLTFVTDVSTFALNLTVAMALCLAIDYTLLILSRYRDERSAGAPAEDALTVTMATAGRTVLFSATTVGCSMLALTLFPMYFLRSFGLAGCTVVVLTALAALLIGPAAIALLGDRIDALDVRPLARRLLRRPPREHKRPEETLWYRSARFATRRAVPVALAGATLLLVLGAPFLGVRWGFPDERMLPASASARQVGDLLREDFPHDPGTAITVVVPDITGVDAREIGRFTRDLSTTPEVSSASGPTGTYVGGVMVGPPGSPAGVADGGAYFTVNSTAPTADDAEPSQLDWLHGVIGPAGRPYVVGGAAQVNADNAAAINARLPLVLLVIAAVTVTLLFLLTGSVLLPIKAVLLNMLSLTATFGALVWIFQDGHLGALGTTATGTLVAHVPVLLFCVAFGLSMDYEVFLISRIREYWLASRRSTAADNDEAIARGLAGTGRIVTAAALLMSISFAALTASDVSIMRMFGLGLTLAVLMDATLVRMLLVPAVMHLLGRANWWAPLPMMRWHSRIGLSDIPLELRPAVREPARPGGRHRVSRRIRPRG